MNPTLFYIIGASGVGKDTLLLLLRDKLAGCPIMFAHRYITRPLTPEGEQHVPLSVKEFKAREKAGCFAMHWHSHNLTYGIGVEINHWLANGLSVIVNGSREYLPEALKQYPALHPVLITASVKTITDRLHRRSREDSGDISKRIQQNKRLEQIDKTHPELKERISYIDNNGSIEAGLKQLLHIVTASQAA